MKSVKIYAIHYNRPDFIVWQYDTFKHHLKDQFEYIVINNARDPVLRKEINQLTQQLNIKCIETFSNSNLSGKHHADSFNYIWKNFAIKNSNNYSIMMDGDCFLIKSFNINDFMKNFIFAGAKQKRNPNYYYLTPGIIISDIDNIKNLEIIDWEGIDVNGVRLDSGGGLYNFYLKHPEIKLQTKELYSSWHIKNENNNKHCLPDNLLNEYNDDYHIEFFGNEFLHYCRSSNWNYQTDEHHRLKTEFVKKFVYGTIDKTIIAKEHNYQINNKEFFGWDEE